MKLNEPAERVGIMVQSLSVMKSGRAKAVGFSTSTVFARHWIAVVARSCVMHKMRKIDNGFFFINLASKQVKINSPINNRGYLCSYHSLAVFLVGFMCSVPGIRHF